MFVRIAVNMLCLGQRKGDVSSVIRALKIFFVVVMLLVKSYDNCVKGSHNWIIR